MAQVFDTSAETTPSGDDSWPWRCLDCEGTIYHDSELCRDCQSVLTVAGGASGQQPDRDFVDWIRLEPYLAFVTKVTAVASLELTLTTLWLQLMVFGSSGVVGLPGVI